MTPREAAAKVREMAVRYATGPKISASLAFIDAAQIIDQIDQPQPWPPPEDVQDCLAFNPLYGVWANKSKTKSSSWSDRIPYRNAYTHWLPMPPAPEVQG